MSEFIDTAAHWIGYFFIGLFTLWGLVEISMLLIGRTLRVMNWQVLFVKWVAQRKGIINERE